MATFERYFEMLTRITPALADSPNKWKAGARDNWNTCRGDEFICQSAANMLVDWFSDTGTSAIRKLQIVLGLKTTGNMTPNVMRVINSMPPEMAFNRIKSARESYYRKSAMVGSAGRNEVRARLDRMCKIKYEEGR